MNNINEAYAHVLSVLDIEIPQSQVSVGNLAILVSLI